MNQLGNHFQGLVIENLRSLDFLREVELSKYFLLVVVYYLLYFDIYTFELFSIACGV